MSKEVVISTPSPVLVKSLWEMMHKYGFVLVKQITGETVGEVKPVTDMHQRKAEMARHSDCFIALPGLSHENLIILLLLCLLPM